MEDKRETYTEENKLIAEFMGDCIVALRENSTEGNSSGYHDKLFSTWEECQLFCDGLNANKCKDLLDNRDFIPFHRSVVMRYREKWDWLMPVVAKLSSEPYIEKIPAYAFEDLKRYLITGDIESAYKEVVVLIKTLN